jgi:hypothetical protein
LFYINYTSYPTTDDQHALVACAEGLQQMNILYDSNVNYYLLHDGTYLFQEKKNINHDDYLYIITGYPRKLIENDLIKNIEVILVVPWYNISDEVRYKEIHTCLKKNLNNNFIKKIVFFYEVEDKTKINYQSYQHDKITIVPKLTDKKRDVSFNEMVDYCNNNFMNEICMISNNDIYFDSSLLELQTIDFMNYKYFISLTRKNCDKYLNRKNEIWKPHDMSQDTWIFQAPLKLLKNNVNLGWVQCDNIISESYHELGYNVINPHYSINSWHLHRFNETKTLLNNFSYNGKFKMRPVPLESLNDIFKRTEKQYPNISSFIPRHVIFKKNRKYKTILLDHSDDLMISLTNAKYYDYYFVTSYHKNTIKKIGNNIYPMVFNSTNKIIKATNNSNIFSNRKTFLLYSHPKRDSITEFMLNNVYSKFSNLIKQFNDTHHNPSFYESLKNSKIVDCTTGILRENVVRQIDSCKLWEAFFSGCCVVLIDLDYFGIKFPVQPTNMKHYVGITLNEKIDYEIFKDIVNGKINIENIANEGQKWAIENYSPSSFAKYILNTTQFFEPLNNNIVQASGHKKYFCIGLHKTGTSTLHKIALNNKLKSTHSTNWQYNEKKIKKYDFFCDGGSHYNNIYEIDYEYLHSKYPNSIFIINIREPRSWIISKLKHAGWDEKTVVVPDNKSKNQYNWKKKTKRNISLFICHYFDRYIKILEYFLNKQDKGYVVDIVSGKVENLKLLSNNNENSNQNVHEKKGNNKNLSNEIIEFIDNEIYIVNKNKYEKLELLLQQYNF